MFFRKIETIFCHVLLHFKISPDTFSEILGLKPKSIHLNHNFI